MTFGRKLQNLRRQRGMSQDVLAEQLGVSRQAVSKWERDEAMPDTENVVRLAFIFDVSLDWLLLDREVQQQQENSYTTIRRDVKKHGYKLGYFVCALGVLFCAMSLVLWLSWPGIAETMFGQESLRVTYADPYESKTYEVIVDGEKQTIETVPDWFLERKMAEQGYTPEKTTMATSLGRAVDAQAKLFLFGILPGAAVLLAGILIVRKGQKKQ